jgi:hypothetical protein
MAMPVAPKRELLDFSEAGAESSLRGVETEEG